MRLVASVVAVLLLAAAAPAVVGQGDAEYSRQGADTCLNCHDDEVSLAVFRTPHAVPGNNPSPFGHGQLQCEACHGPGGAHAGRVPRGEERPAILSFSDRYPADVSVENGMCLNCHGDAVNAGWHSGAHAARDIGCTDCHSSHVPRDPVLQTATQPAVCYECHQVTRSEANKPFAHPFRQGKMDCSGCHSAHGDNVATGLVRQTLNDTCYQCHAQTRGPFLWEHAPVSEDCSLCHSPHGSIHPAMLTRRGPLLCQSCHSQAGHPSIPYDTDDLPSGVPSRYLLGQNCLNCHSQVHGSNHPSGSRLMR
jgi:DmsE family decaheme c-type cytochrome